VNSELNKLSETSPSIPLTRSYFLREQTIIKVKYLSEYVDEYYKKGCPEASYVYRKTIKIDMRAQ
jgi:hypothetical protein